MGKRKPLSVVKHPKVDEAWKDSFRNASLKIGLTLNLTKTMLEFLCAVADNVAWDRSLYPMGRAAPERWLSTEEALKKRGLILDKPDRPFMDGVGSDDPGSFQTSLLSPAGRCVVELLKITGIFVEPDAAIAKRSKRA